MDAGTHALASVAVARILVPRAPLLAWMLILAAGTIADLDAVSSLFGPSAYLDWLHTYTHSVVAAAAFGLIGVGVLYFSAIRQPLPAKTSKIALLGAFLLSSFLHIAMDACQSSGIALFWPFSVYRFAADWLPSIDPWIIAILVAALVLPELSRLVGDEIGAKSKAPRGRVGASIGLILVVLYVGARANFHAGVLAAIQARTYRGEPARRAGAYAESVSPFTWHAIVETDRALQELIIDATLGASFDTENGTILFKPEPSPILDRAQNTQAATKFLRAASFPKATIEKTPEGYVVQIQDLRYAVSGDSRHEIVAVIQADSDGRIRRDQLLWARDYHRH
jgi:membrane-bound metal-dependent hydrolase YbcI (DUF457 family)